MLAIPLRSLIKDAVSVALKVFSFSPQRQEKFGNQLYEKNALETIVFIAAKNYDLSVNVLFQISTF